MIEPRLARRIGELVAPGVDPDAAPPGPPLRLAEHSLDAEDRVGAYTGLRAPGGVPAAEPVSRPDWIEANARSMEATLAPVADALGRGLGPAAPLARLAAGALLTAEVGALLGLMSGRVLGQYDVALLDPSRPPRLLYVEPNLEAAARRLDLPREPLARWVALHEVTHALQFGGVPWLRDHLATSVRTLLEGVQARSGPGGLSLRIPRPDPEALLRAVREVRRDGLLALAGGAEQREALGRLQVTMAVVEGHAEHVMDAVGADVLPELPRLRKALDQRRREGPLLAKLLNKLLGIDVKLRQYEEGKRFWDAVVGAAGDEAGRRIWSGPDALPTADELARPDAWLRRQGLAPAVRV